MSGPVPDGNEACWECGAPAHPGCALILALWAPARAHRDACGYPVEHGARYDTLRLAVPRCSACCDRRILNGFCGFAVFLVVSAIAALWQRYAHWIVVSIVLMAIAVFLTIHEEGPRYRDIQDYPPLRRLRRAGWEGCRKVR